MARKPLGNCRNGHEQRRWGHAGGHTTVYPLRADLTTRHPPGRRRLFGISCTAGRKCAEPGQQLRGRERQQQLALKATQPQNALDVFYQPYAYAAAQGIGYALGATAASLEVVAA